MPGRAASGLLVCFCALAQAPASFDAASVRPWSGPPAGSGLTVERKQPGVARRIGQPSGGPGTSDPGRIHYPGVTLQFVMMQAYDVMNFQIVGPSWFDSERYDIDATMPSETSRERFRLMLQNLLAERFKLTLHRESRELPAYSLVTTKNGPKMKSSAPPAGPDQPVADQPLKPGPDGYFVPPPGPGMFLQMTANRGARETFHQFTMPELAKTLQSQLKRPVADATGLTGAYDFVLNFSIEGVDFGSGRIPVSQGDPEPQPDIFSALQSQLGLKLESNKQPAAVLVIDHLEKVPTGN